jgi:alcohol dehydrogenase
VIEATGSVDGLQQAVQMVRPRGTVFMKSTVHGKPAIDTAPIIVNEITMVGSRCGRFEPALNLLQSRSVNVADMISDAFPLSAAPSALDRAAKRGVMKVLLNSEA